MTKTIFIVDDSATMLMSVKSALTMTGFKVETASDGLQALAKLKGGITRRPRTHPVSRHHPPAA